MCVCLLDSAETDGLLLLHNMNDFDTFVASVSPQCFNETEWQLVLLFHLAKYGSCCFLWLPV